MFYYNNYIVSMENWNRISGIDIIRQTLTKFNHMQLRNYNTYIKTIFTIFMWCMHKTFKCDAQAVES